MKNACFLPIYSTAVRENKFPNIDISATDHYVAQWGVFKYFDFGVEVCLFCFKLIGHWLILGVKQEKSQLTKLSKHNNPRLISLLCKVWPLIFTMSTLVWPHTHSCIYILYCKCMFTNERCVCMCLSVIHVDVFDWGSAGGHKAVKGCLTDEESDSDWVECL